MFSKDEDECVDDDSNTDDGDDDDNLNGGEDIEGNEPINDDERCDDDGRENIVAEDGAGVFDWNEIDAEIEQKNEIVQKEWRFMKERSPIVRTHQLHVTIDLAKTLKTPRISISVKIIILWST